MLTARLNLLDLKPGDRVLDLGCGEGRHVHGLSMIPDVNVVGLDMHTPSLAKAREGLATIRPPDMQGSVEFLCGDATQLPFPDNSFDALICSEVLEHLPDFEAALFEIRRVLKPGGRLCISVPHGWTERICWRLAPPPDGYAYEPGGHIRIFDDTHLEIAIRRQGFRRTHRHHAHGIHMPYWWLKCLFWRREDDHPLVRGYHKLLVWDILKRPLATRLLDAMLSPVIGKSVVLYFTSEDAAT